VPGIIVSRPIFNTLFKLAHEQGLSINAFLTKLLENAGTEGVSQAAAGSFQVVEPVEQVVDERNEVRVGAANFREIEAGPANVTPLTALPVAPPVHAGQAGDSYIGETEKNAAALNGRPGRAAAAVSGDDAGGAIWNRVVAMEGKKFATSRGKKFSYKVSGEYVIVKESSARIPRSQFAKAEKMWPVKGPSQLVGVYAPSVVWAIMKEMADQPVAS
jgi:hypothetical protein